MSRILILREVTGSRGMEAIRLQVVNDGLSAMSPRRTQKIMHSGFLIATV